MQCLTEKFLTRYAVKYVLLRKRAFINKGKLQRNMPTHLSLVFTSDSQSSTAQMGTFLEPLLEDVFSGKETVPGCLLDGERFW